MLRLGAEIYMCMNGLAELPGGLSQENRKTEKQALAGRPAGWPARRPAKPSTETEKHWPAGQPASQTASPVFTQNQRNRKTEKHEKHKNKSWQANPPAGRPT